MAADPAILKRIRACPFARGGRVLVRFRANGYRLFARRSGEPLARLARPATATVVLIYPSHLGASSRQRCSSASNNASLASSFLAARRSTPGMIAPTSQLDWLISITTISDSVYLLKRENY